MKLWLVRHAQPLVEAGMCYGASDIAADPAATQQAAQGLAAVLPQGVCVVSSPLQRCEQLTEVLRGLRPDLTYRHDARLVEMDFGQWEGQRWDSIPRAELDGWTAAFDTWRCGSAESVADVMRRVGAVWDETRALQQPTVWITHAGVIRAATLLAQGQRQIRNASAWPKTAPAWGEWQQLDL
ncbi:histidine phosphatase family protein [Rhodoferax sp. AJA081-3]|uniref:histidine phosphatase family protein n=1 Tax=Rhodoferax sp. AJA081-3 TaxID=2752316 RepID=UPI001ADEF021|nr:histidine phosphatase family protein [Rhodoferax sp. AJA081-3]QTN29056.1 histidine phosphatase family protein [Rhodoferax sp. AJA081-3]